MATTDWAQKNFIARKPLLTYFVFSFVFFWLFLALFVAVLNIFHLRPDTLPSWLIPLVTIVGSWMPTLAAVIVTGILEGSGGFSRLFQKFIHFKIPARWYLASLIPFGLAFTAVWIYQMSAGGLFAGSHPSTNFWVGLIIVNFLAGPTGEELG